MQITATHVTGLFFILLFSYLWMPPTWLLMRFLTPRKLVERYFKKPHFTNAELALFSHFPGTLMRTMIFIAACVHPHRGKKRQMTDVPDHVPNWYLTLAKCFYFLCLGHFALIIILLLGLAIHLELTT